MFLLKIFANFSEKHLQWSLFLVKFVKKILQHRCFPAKLTKFSRAPLFTEHHLNLYLKFKSNALWDTQETADSVPSTAEILNGKLYFLFKRQYFPMFYLRQSPCHISNNQLICTVRGSRSRCSAEKVFSGNSQNLHESTCSRVSFLIKLRSPQVCKFIKNETLAQVFFCKFCEIPKIWEHLFLQNTSGGCFYTVNQLNVRYITGSLALKVL